MLAACSWLAGSQTKTDWSIGRTDRRTAEPRITIRSSLCRNLIYYPSRRGPRETSPTKSNFKVNSRSAVHPSICLSYRPSVRPSSGPFLCPSFHANICPLGRIEVFPSFCPSVPVPTFPSSRLSFRPSFLYLFPSFRRDERKRLAQESVGGKGPSVHFSIIPSFLASFLLSVLPFVRPSVYLSFPPAVLCFRLSFRPFLL